MKRHLFWIVELFIWLLILFAISGVFILIKYNYKKNFETYQMFLPDVDGLINGSPVKLLGIQIGYVNQISIVGEDVYVRFITTKKGVRIPHGSKATVEFSGLGGSKSLEIYPPTKKEVIGEKIITPQPPKRIHDSLGLLNDMFEKFVDITYIVSHFMNRLGVIKPESFNGASKTSAEDALNKANKWLDQAQDKSNQVSDKINKKDSKNEQRKNQSN